ncbi:hypothetical protein K505DRAFT_282953 [Melanomma pulvis-pyrius CBS 109.77]|uniref:Uncharacterized protein n=1 Tax=Melanomma pulvis-pyrius CBS 109.77 TaxID=1314802 RepID=A0A6A6X1N8_9PLEO|nr:hypothetical protein K505DRAFT_282953 [Melanomma pulvis-pyrius CBS 109.77]
MRFLSLLAVGCGLVSAAVLSKDPEGLGRDLALEEAWSLAQVKEFTGNVTALLEEEAALQDRSLEKRKCFATGEKFGNERDTARRAAEFVCYNKLASSFSRGTVRSICINLHYNKRVNFKLGLTGPNAPARRTIGGAECRDGMFSEIDSCSKGGETTYGRWYYRVDPNKGYC